MLAVDAIRVAALAPQSPAPAEDQPLRGVRIFFAEDGPDNQRLIAFHLRRAGAEVRIFDNGRLTLQGLTTTGEPDGPLADPPPCDFILTDMQMPEIDGYTLARTLRTAGWKRPIIALTAHAMLGDADKCRDAGCDDYASKPVNRDKLINICLRAAARARPLSPVAADRAA
jgi:CheY-like chemotaxis protein